MVEGLLPTKPLCLGHGRPKISLPPMEIRLFSHGYGWMTHWLHMINLKGGQNIVTIHLSEDIFGNPCNIQSYTRFHSKKQCGNLPISTMLWMNDSLITHC